VYTYIYIFTDIYIINMYICDILFIDVIRIGGPPTPLFKQGDIIDGISMLLYDQVIQYYKCIYIHLCIYIQMNIYIYTYFFILGDIIDGMSMLLYIHVDIYRQEMDGMCRINHIYRTHQLE
jgi:hypothetical protein